MSIAEERVEFKSLEKKGNCQVKVGKGHDINFQLNNIFKNIISRKIVKRTSEKKKIFSHNVKSGNAFPTHLHVPFIQYYGGLQ